MALQPNPQSPLSLSLSIAALMCLAVHHPDTLAQPDVLPLDLLVNAGALQQRALLRIIRTAPSLRQKYVAALATLATSADPLTSTEAIRLLGTSALGSPLPSASLSGRSPSDAGDWPNHLYWCANRLV